MKTGNSGPFHVAKLITCAETGKFPASLLKNVVGPPVVQSKTVKFAE